MDRKRSLGPISGFGFPKVDSEVEVLLSLPQCSTPTTTAAGGASSPSTCSVHKVLLHLPLLGELHLFPSRPPAERVCLCAHMHTDALVGCLIFILINCVLNVCRRYSRSEADFLSIIL